MKRRRAISQTKRSCVSHPKEKSPPLRSIVIGMKVNCKWYLWLFLILPRKRPILS